MKTTSHVTRAPGRGQPSQRGRGISLRLSDSSYGFLLTLPAMLFAGLAVFYPLTHVISLSLRESDLMSMAMGDNQFVGLQHYQTLLLTPRFISAIRNTFVYLSFTISIQLVLGLALALLLNQDVRGTTAFRTILISPMMIAPVVAGLIWAWVYAADYGILNNVLASLGLPTPLWLASIPLAMVSVIIADVWLFTPFVMMILLASLQTHPKEPYEAATIDGASQWQLFRYIMLPFLKPALLIVLVIRTMDSLRVFDLVYALTGGGPARSTEMISIFAYQRSFAGGEFGLGSAASIVLMALTFVISLVYVKFVRTERA